MTQCNVNLVPVLFYAWRRVLMDVAKRDWTCFYGAGWRESPSLLEGLTAVWL